MSGYFRPMANRVEYKNAIKNVDPFHHDAALRRQNSPLDILHQLPAGSRIPQFWVAAARAVRGDVLNAISFVDLAQGAGSGDSAEYHAKWRTQRRRMAQHDRADAGVDDAAPRAGRERLRAARAASLRPREQRLRRRARRSGSTAR